MSAPVYYCSNTAYNISAVHTVLNVIAGANQPINVVAFGVSFDGATSTATPAKVELCQSTQAGAGTAGASPPTPVQISGHPITFQPTVAHNYTAEPTVLTTVWQHFIPQDMGVYTEQFEAGSELETDLSGGTVKAIAMRVTPSAAVNCLAWMRVTIG